MTDAMPARLNPRGKVGIFGRMPTLHVEATTDFVAGVRVWTDSALWRTAEKRAIEILKEHGHAA